MLDQRTPMTSPNKKEDATKNIMRPSLPLRMTVLGLYSYIPLGIVFFWIELNKISDNDKGSSDIHLPELTVAIFLLPFLLMLVAVLDATYRLAYNKSLIINKLYISLFGVLLLSLVIGWSAINSERSWEKHTTLPIITFWTWVIYNLLMFVNIYFTTKASKNIT